LTGWAKKNQVHHALAKWVSAGVKRLTDRHAVEDHERTHRPGIVQGQPHRNVAAAVVADGTEAVVSEPTHQGSHIGGHRPVAARPVI